MIARGPWRVISWPLNVREGFIKIKIGTLCANSLKFSIWKGFYDFELQYRGTDLYNKKKSKIDGILPVHSLDAILETTFQMIRIKKWDSIEYSLVFCKMFANKASSGFIYSILI